MQKIKIILAFAVCILINAYGFTQIPDIDLKEKQIDAFIQKIMNDVINTEAGIAISFIVEDNVEFEKVYGKSNVAVGKNANKNTPFYVASVTKSYITLLAKILEQDGIIKLNEPISIYLKDHLKFENSNLSTSKITIRDLLTHQSGIINDAITWRTSYTGEGANDLNLLLEIFKTSKYDDKPFHYSNSGYILTAIIIEKLTGKTWKELLNEKIFKLLSLSKTSANPYLDFDYYSPALGHTISNGKTIVGEAQKQNENCNAAGGIFSSLIDLEKWLFVHMNSGKYNGNQIFNKQHFEEIHKPQVLIESSFYSYDRYAYDLGWYHGFYEGAELIHCFGSFPGGYRTHVSYMPRNDIGVIVTTNLFPEGVFLPDIVANYIYDVLLDKPDLETKYSEVLKRYPQIVKYFTDERLIDVDSTEVYNEKKLKSEKYFNSEYGTLKIEYIDEVAVAKFGTLGLVAAPLIQFEDTKYRLNNPDFFRKNDYIDTSNLSNQFITLKRGENEIRFDLK